MSAINDGGPAFTRRTRGEEVARLAREIGFSDQYEDQPGVIGLFVADLLCQLAANVETGAPQAKHICAVAHQLFSRLALDNDRQSLILAGTQVSDLVDSIDCDDGWPQCPYLNCVKACALALQWGLGSDSSRWPAECANAVGALVLGLVKWNADTKEQRHDFARSSLRRALCRFARHDQDENESYEIGKRDGYEDAIQDLDIATGGDGEFKGSTLPGGTVDVPTMKARIIERFSDANARAPGTGGTG